MKSRSSRPRYAGVFAIAALTAAGCASDFVKVAPQPPTQYQKLGKAEGSSCGSLLLLATAYYFIPVGLNERVATAYQNAVASIPGATALVDVSIQEDWTWWLIGTMRCVTIKGEAIKGEAIK
jgi:hypothetical protein